MWGGDERVGGPGGFSANQFQLVLDAVAASENRCARELGNRVFAPANVFYVTFGRVEEWYRFISTFVGVFGALLDALTRRLTSEPSQTSANPRWARRASWPVRFVVDFFVSTVF